MKILDINFWGDGIFCHAQVELDGMAESWTAKASITGHPTIKDLSIRYRLGDYLSPVFLSE
jgi:hypothetical protein